MKLNRDFTKMTPPKSSDDNVPPHSIALRSFTGAEAGFKGEEQIKIALQEMARRGGSATMQQITEALERALRERNPYHGLSKQGKASLRRYVNFDAVEKGWVYKYHQSQTAWRITPSGRAAVSALLSGQPTQSADWSPIGQDFQLALTDVFALLEAEDKLRKNEDIPPAFVRAGMILTVTAWETFVEDTVRARFESRLARANEPGELSSAAAAVAKKWLEGFGDKRPGPKELLTWAGSGWKKQVAEHFANDIRTFNTPSSTNVAKITKQYVGEDMTSLWSWHDIEPRTACTRLDELIRLRGSLVHRARSRTEQLAMDGKTLLGSLELVEQLAWTTDVKWNRRED